MSAYDVDLHAWAHEQAALARDRSDNRLDWDNVAEELESLGKQQVCELKSRYVVLLAHLLKWIVQPERRGRSWLATIAEQRDAIADHIEINPSLRASDAETFGKAYRLAVKRAAGETDLPFSAFPQEPFTAEEARDESWWPDETPPDA